MKGTILLNYSENTQQIESEEKFRFLRDLLSQMFEGTPDVLSQIETIWGQDIFLSTIQKVEMRKLLTVYNIQVLDDNDGQMKVYAENELVGQFFKPTYKLKRDYSYIDKKKQLFLEMSINCWSVFEPAENQETE
jgi:hypothetical protein